MRTRSPVALGAIGFLGAAVLTLAVACGDDDDGGNNDGGNNGSEPAATAPGGGGATNGPNLSGVVEIDGSSTVFPITEAVAEEFRNEAADVRVPVGVSGTGGGFSRFCEGETDISDASRPIETGDNSEAATCEANGIEFIEVPVAYDGLSVVVHPNNDWVSCVTVEELNTIWSPDSEGVVSNWSDVNPDWPDEEIELYGPGTDSGTFDYFTEVINGAGGASRTDYTPSEDDNVLVQGVAGDPNALGYFGLAYLEENQGRIQGLEVDGGGGCVAPTEETVENGTYSPLSRPLFIYIKVEAAERPEVQAFVDFYLDNVPALAADVGYVRFPDSFYEVIRGRWDSRETGSMFSGAAGSVGEILGVE